MLDPAVVDFRAADARPQYQPDVLQPIGEAVVLAGVWKLTGSDHWLPYQLLMIALSAAMVPLVFYIGLSLFGRRRAAYLGALLYAVFPPLAWLTTVPHLDAWSVDLTIVITALLVRARSGSNRDPMAAGGWSGDRPWHLLPSGRAVAGAVLWRCVSHPQGLA